VGPVDHDAVDEDGEAVDIVVVPMRTVVLLPVEVHLEITACGDLEEERNRIENPRQVVDPAEDIEQMAAHLPVDLTRRRRTGARRSGSEERPSDEQRRGRERRRERTESEW
jgi:hypothetical protein